MARMLGFGQPCGAIMQAAYVVADLRAAIAHYTSVLGAGPFFLIDRATSPTRTWRGAVSPTTVSLAMGFSGHLQIELIQLHDNAPSILREGVERHGYGFHHFGIALDDVEGALPGYFARGFTEVSRNRVPTGGEVVFLEAPDPVHPGYLELLPATPEMDRRFTAFWQASVDWDGSQPIRPFD